MNAPNPTSEKTLLIFERGAPGRGSSLYPDCDVPDCAVDPVLLRSASPDLAEVSEVEAVRHYTWLSTRNFGVETGFYPLGSCTMKYNPKENEAFARLPGFAGAHPLQDPATAQGCLALMHDLADWLSRLCGMSAFSLQPAAGAHGELTGLMCIRAYHRHRGDAKRIVVLVPDSAHGTNPASAAVAGLEVREVPSGPDGMVDLDALDRLLGDDELRARLGGQAQERALREFTVPRMVTRTLDVYAEAIERHAAHAAASPRARDAAGQGRT